MLQHQGELVKVVCVQDAVVVQIKELHARIPNKELETVFKFHIL
jgi:hypothetical protein